MYKISTENYQVVVAKWVRLWVFNVKVPGSNAGWFYAGFFSSFFFATLITLVVPMLQFLTITL